MDVAGQSHSGVQRFKIDSAIGTTRIYELPKLMLAKDSPQATQVKGRGTVQSLITMSHAFAEIPVSLEADEDLNALVPQSQDLVKHAPNHIV